MQINKVLVEKDDSFSDFSDGIPYYLACLCTLVVSIAGQVTVMATTERMKIGGRREISSHFRRRRKVLKFDLKEVHLNFKLVILCRSVFFTWWPHVAPLQRFSHDFLVHVRRWKDFKGYGAIWLEKMVSTVFDLFLLQVRIINKIWPFGYDKYLYMIFQI